MTLKDILESGYGIDFSTLSFEIIKDADACPKEEILKSIEENELVFQIDDLHRSQTIMDFGILDDKKRTTFYRY